VLNLDRTPASELLGQTALAWGDALWPGRAWHESDGVRLIEAFRRLSAAVRQWPAPVDLLAHLPPRDAGTLPALPPRVETEADRQAALAKLRAMAAALDVPPPPEPAKEPGAPLAQVEAELQAHYAATRGDA
jgi:hypothetical protein